MLIKRIIAVVTVILVAVAVILVKTKRQTGEQRTHAEKSTK